MKRNNTEIQPIRIDMVVEALCQIHSPEQMKQFLNEVLTPGELHDLALRWELMRRLARGDSQRQIAGEMGISLCKITRGSKILKEENSITRSILVGRKTNEPKNPA